MTTKALIAVASWGLTAVMMAPHIGSIFVLTLNAGLLIALVLPTELLKRKS